MTRDEAVAEIQFYLGKRRDSAADIVTKLELGQRHLERNWPTRPLPWFLLTERASTTMVASEERVAIPTDFIEEWEGSGMWVVDSNGGEHLVKKFDSDDARLYEQERTDFGTLTLASSSDRLPNKYAMTGDYFRFFPTPATALTLKMIYYQTQDLPSSGSVENRWLKYAPYVLIGWAGERMAIVMRPDVVGVFQEMKTSAIGALNIQSVERQMSNRQMAMGETI